MKNYLSFLLTLVLLTSVFVGCSVDNREYPYPDNGVVGGEELSDGRVVGGEKYGRINDKMQTYWFNFTITGASKTNKLNDLVADEGYVYLAVTLSMENTFDRAITLEGSDLPLYFARIKDTAYQEYTIPSKFYLNGEKSDAYTIAAGKKEDVLLFFEVPAEAEAFAIAYLEMYADEKKGNLFVVEFAV